MAFWGVGNNLVVYLIDVMHLGNAAAANIMSNWVGTANITPLIAAFLADSYWGRFWTCVILSSIHVHGVALMTIAAALPSLRPEQCRTSNSPVSTCPQASTGHMAMLYLGLYIIALGGGGVQSPLTTFGADQFDEEDDREKHQKSSFFNWYYGATNLGFMVSVTLLLYFQGQVGYGVGYGVSTGAAFLALVILMVGLPIYRYPKLSPDPFNRIAQVLVASARKRQLQMPPIDQLHELHELEDHQPIINSKRIPHTQQFRFLDKAAIVTETASSEPWQLCTISQVEEVKSLLRLMPIFTTTLFFSTIYTQHSTLFVEQAMTMDRRVGSIQVPPASMRVFETLSVMGWVAIYDKLLVGALRRRTGHPRGLSELQRVGIGLALSIVAMALAAAIETKRLQAARGFKDVMDDRHAFVPMSVLWLVPQHILVGASETFVFVGQSEFFYGQVPAQLRSVGSALALLSGAFGGYLSTALVTVVNRVTRNPGWIADNLNRGQLDYFFWLLAGLSVVNLFFFVVCAGRYTRVYGKATRTFP